MYSESDLRTITIGTIFSTKTANLQILIIEIHSILKIIKLMIANLFLSMVKIQLIFLMLMVNIYKKTKAIKNNQTMIITTELILEPEMILLILILANQECQTMIQMVVSQTRAAVDQIITDIIEIILICTLTRFIYTLTPMKNKMKISNKMTSKFLFQLGFHRRIINNPYLRHR